MSKIYKFGIIGAGMIADYHAKAIRDIDDAELVGIYGRNSNKTTSLASKYGCQAYDDIDDMLSDQSVDVVTIATPSGVHLDPTLMAAKAGKHVLCEKPLEITVERIQRMIETCADYNVLLGGIFNRRFNPAVRALKRAIDKGRFGNLALADAQIKWYRSQEYYDSGQWRGTWQLDGGGALMNQAIHTIDLLQYFMGGIDQVCALTNTVAHKNIEVEDNAVAILKFNNGALGSIQASTACWSENGHPATINISGDQGSVFMADDKFILWEFSETLKEDEQVYNQMMNGNDVGLGANDPNAIDHQGHIANIQDFIDSLENGRNPEVSGIEALKSVKIIRAIYESAHNDRKWVKP